MEHLAGKTNGHGERLLRYLARNGGQAKRLQLQKSRILRGSPEAYDPILESLINSGVIICEDNTKKKTDWIYKLAKPQLVETKPVNQSDQAADQAVSLEERQCQETPKTTVKQEKILITPEMAREMLARNSFNRPVRKTNLEFLVNAIRGGHWVMTGNAIAFDKQGRLLDGQHRLMAIIETAQTVESLVVWGLNEEAFKTTDSGCRRGAHDIAAMLGFKHYFAVGSAATLLHYYKNGMSRYNQGISNMIVENILKENKEIGNSVQTVSEVRRIMPLGIAGCCHYLFQKIDQGMADQFFQKLITGAELQQTSPILLLREKMLLYQAKKIVLTRLQIMAITIKTWNYYRKGKIVKKLDWKTREHFPIAA